MIEKRRIARSPVSTTSHSSVVNVGVIAAEFSHTQKEQRAALSFTPRTARWTVWANTVLTLGLIAVLISGITSPAPAFLVGTAVLLLTNFTSLDDQSEVLRRHAPTALAMAGVILAAAMFLGVLDATGMLEQIALSLISILPAVVGPYIHFIIGFFGVPLDLATSTDAYYFSVLPIVQETAQSVGVSGLGVASAMIVGNVIGTFVSPFSPALWLGIGFAGVNMGKYIRVAFPIAWAFSVVLVAGVWTTGMLA